MSIFHSTFEKNSWPSLYFHNNYGKSSWPSLYFSVRNEKVANPDRGLSLLERVAPRELGPER